MTQEPDDVTQRRKLIEREIFARRDVEVLLQFAEQLCLLDRIDPQVRFQVGIELDHFGRVSGLLDDEVHHETLEIGRIGSGSNRRVRRRRRGRGYRRRRLSNRRRLRHRRCNDWCDRRG